MSLTPRICLRVALPVLLGSLSGCGAQAGGQTGEESDGGCVFTTSQLSEQERSPLGFSSAEVLALVGDERSATFEWLRSAGLDYGPESGAGAVTVRVTPAGPARFARIDVAESAFHCQDHLRVPVRVTLATGGGAFDETFEASLIATSADEATLMRLVPSADLRGAFAFAPGALTGRRFLRLEVNLRFRAEAFAGHLFADVEGSDAASQSGSLQLVPLACWSEIPSLPGCSE